MLEWLKPQEGEQVFPSSTEPNQRTLRRSFLYEVAFGIQSWLLITATSESFSMIYNQVYNLE